MAPRPGAIGRGGKDQEKGVQVPAGAEAIPEPVVR